MYSDPRALGPRSGGFSRVLRRGPFWLLRFSVAVVLLLTLFIVLDASRQDRVSYCAVRLADAGDAHQASILVHR